MSTPWKPPFQSPLVLDERIHESRIRAYYVGFDQQAFRLKPLTDVIIDVIPEFAMGVYEGTTVEVATMIPRIREAARRIYSTDKYQNRGEFGELILHLLLRDFCKSVPLVSKIYFKDADNATVHGFDAVHVVVDGTTKELWLGESKLYDDGPAGIRDLLKDLESHVEADYLRREFQLIGPKLPATDPDIEYWRSLLHQNQRLETILDKICIPMMCTYTSRTYTDHCDNTAECLAQFMDECGRLQGLFEHGAARLSIKVDVILLLLPVQSKPALVTALHERLRSLQGI
jgi:hypothetical protein